MIVAARGAPGAVDPLTVSQNTLDRNAASRMPGAAERACARDGVSVDASLW